jgi:hypothetical protein
MQATLKTLNLLYEALGRPSEAESFKSVLAGNVVVIASRFF